VGYVSGLASNGVAYSINDEKMEKSHQSLQSQRWSSTLLQHNGFQNPLKSISPLYNSPSGITKLICMYMTKECDLNIINLTLMLKSNALAH
jgi:hypothetical protein